MVRNYAQRHCPRCGRPIMGCRIPPGCHMTQEMWDYLLAYRKANGKRWKSKLTDAWANRPMSVGPVLIQVRNIIGPTRLYKLKFQKEAKC